MVFLVIGGLVVAGFVLLIAVGLAPHMAARKEFNKMCDMYPDAWEAFKRRPNEQDYMRGSRVNFAKLALDFHKFLVTCGTHKAS
jgi:hypothetical protein